MDEQALVAADSRRQSSLLPAPASSSCFGGMSRRSRQIWSCLGGLVPHGAGFRLTDNLADLLDPAFAPAGAVSRYSTLTLHSLASGARSTTPCSRQQQLLYRSGAALPGHWAPAVRDMHLSTQYALIPLQSLACSSPNTRFSEGQGERQRACSALAGAAAAS